MGSSAIPDPVFFEENIVTTLETLPERRRASELRQWQLTRRPPLSKLIVRECLVIRFCDELRDCGGYSRVFGDERFISSIRAAESHAHAYINIHGNLRQRTTPCAKRSARWFASRWALWK